MSNIIIPTIKESEINTLCQPRLSISSSEILCRLAVIAYMPDKINLSEAFEGNKLGLYSWLESTNENQGFAIWSKSPNPDWMVVSYRGTNELRDWKKNIDAFFPDQHKLGGRRHNGFTRVYEQNSKSVLDLITKINPKYIWLTGHSLGGALSTATAADLLLINRLPSSIFVMTIGSPRYGDENFQRIYDSKLGTNHWFFVNESDPIPHLGPNWMGYRHTGILKFLDKHGTLTTITKDQAGLQSDDDKTLQTIKKMNALDILIEQQAKTRNDLAVLINKIYENYTEYPVTMQNGIIESQVNDSQLQGELPWDIESHDKLIYWKRISELANKYLG